MMVRGIAKHRSRHDIVDDIVVALGPLKPGAGNPRAEIETHIKLIQIEREVLDNTRAMYAAQKGAAENMLKELDSLEGRVWPGIEENSVRNILEWPLKIKAPSRHVNWQQHMCAFHASVLVKQFSKSPPVFSRGGNVHQVALLIFEANTDGPIDSMNQDPARLLRATQQTPNSHLSAAIGLALLPPESNYQSTQPPVSRARNHCRRRSHRRQCKCHAYSLGTDAKHSREQLWILAFQAVSAYMFNGGSISGEESAVSQPR